MKTISALLLAITLSTAGSAMAKLPGLFVQGAGTTTTYGRTPECFSAADDASAKTLAQFDANQKCSDKNGGVGVQYTDFALSHIVTENPAPYGYTCETTAAAPFVCDSGK